MTLSLSLSVVRNSSSSLLAHPVLCHKCCRPGGGIGLFHTQQKGIGSGDGGGCRRISRRCDVGFNGRLPGGSGCLQGEPGDEMNEGSDVNSAEDARASSVVFKAVLAGMKCDDGVK